jgi:hypothetical protein
VRDWRPNAESLACPDVSSGAADVGDSRCDGAPIYEGNRVRDLKAPPPRNDSVDYPLTAHIAFARRCPCGRLCLHRKKINISTVLAGQRLGIKEVDEGIWLVTFMRYDLGYFDLEQKTLQTSTTRSARGCHPCLRYVLSPMCPGRTLMIRPRP